MSRIKLLIYVGIVGWIAFSGMLRYSFAQGSQTDETKQLRAKADQGDAVAQNKLGMMYEKGQGSSQDYSEAVHWYRKAADQGYAEAQFNLGGMYYRGMGA